jgi:serine protease Do
MMNVSDDLRGVHSIGYDKDTGVEVVEVGHRTPATGRLNVNDIITAYDGRTIDNKEDIRDAVAATPPGTEAKLTVYRDGKYQDVTVTIGTQPEDLEAAMRDGNGNGEEPNAEAPRQEQTASTFGLTGLRTLTPALIEELNKEAGGSYLDAGTSGALITDVQGGSIADKAHLAAGDVITHVGRLAVSTSRQAKDALDRADPKQGVRLRVLTPQGPRFAFLASEDNSPSNN